MTKKQFIKTMEGLLNIKKDEDNLNKAFKKFEPDFNYISFGRYEMLIVDTLKIAMDDDADWIEYFLYELFAKFTKKNIITSKEGKKLPLRNMSDLYNLIITK